MCAGTAFHQGTAEESALPCQTWENLQTTQGIPFSKMASAEASRNEQTKTASIDPDSSLDLDLITDNEPFDRFSLHPIAEIELPMDSVELSCPGHIDTHHLIQLESCRPSHSSPIPIPLAASHIVTPLLPRRWEEMLCQHPDQSLAAYIVSGLSNGFHIGYQGDRRSGGSVPANMLSAVRTPMPVEQYLLSEVLAGRISGPFPLAEVPLVHVSRFGVIPKIDQARQGGKLFIGRTNNELCPVAGMLAYLAVRGFDCGPLFWSEDGQPLTRAKLVSLLKATLTAAGIDPTHYSGHSFRIGATTTAAANGISDSMVQTLGRWTSDSYLRCIRMPHQALAQLSASLGK